MLDGDNHSLLNEPEKLLDPTISSINEKHLYLSPAEKGGSSKSPKAQMPKIPYMDFAKRTRTSCAKAEVYF